MIYDTASLLSNKSRPGKCPCQEGPGEIFWHLIRVA